MIWEGSSERSGDEGTEGRLKVALQCRQATLNWGLLQSQPDPFSTPQALKTIPGCYLCLAHMLFFCCCCYRNILNSKIPITSLFIYVEPTLLFWIHLFSASISASNSYLWINYIPSKMSVARDMSLSSHWLSHLKICEVQCWGSSLFFNYLFWLLHCGFFHIWNLSRVTLRCWYLADTNSQIHISFQEKELGFLEVT